MGLGVGGGLLGCVICIGCVFFGFVRWVGCGCGGGVGGRRVLVWGGWVCRVGGGGCYGVFGVVFGWVVVVGVWCFWFALWGWLSVFVVGGGVGVCLYGGCGVWVGFDFGVDWVGGGGGVRGCGRGCVFGFGKVFGLVWIWVL
ncbi:MAG: hypothetical protein U5L45_19810 [Saprospiraceae bacterium]|nr:hypothetical protein [Saprospiraceae bacterium]